MTKKRCNVLIIGFGPTGSVLANLLSKYDISVNVLEKERELYNLPRAVHFDDEVMRIFHNIGIFEKLIKKTIINKGTKFVDDKDNLILDWPRPKQITENGFYPSYRFHQPDLEKILRKNLTFNSNIKIEYDVELVKIFNQKKSVKAQYVDKKTKTLKTIYSDYLVGCDGANSFVRNFVTSEVIDFGFEEKWAVIDLILKKNIKNLPDRTIQYCSKITPATYCRNVGKRRRWEISLKKNLKDEEILKENNVWNFLSKWISRNDADIERKTIYTFKSLIAKKWRKGRVFIAGDAAHQSPPFMGQGMCAGIRDVSNLFWKIAYSCNFGHRQALLDTYETERFENVKQYIKTTINMGKLLNSLGNSNVSDTVKEKEDGSKIMTSIKPPLGPGLGCTKDNLRGEIFPYLKLSKCKKSSFDELYDKEIVLLSKKNFNNKKIRNINIANYLEVTNLFDQLNIEALVVRPDRYILSSLKKGNDLSHFVNETISKII